MDYIKLTLRHLTRLWALLPLLVIACTGQASGPAMVVSVSAKGDYAISSHKDGSVALWDIQNKSARKISNSANIYSAYFVKRAPHYLWQELDNRVHIANTENDKEVTFDLTFPVYGQALSTDLTHYFASDEGWGIYYRHGNSPLKLVKSAWDKSFIGFGKLLNLSISTDNKQLLQSGYTYEYSNKFSLEDYKKKNFYSEMVSPAIWDISTSKPVAKLDGNAAKTYATLSPNGTYVVSGDENQHGLVWLVAKPENPIYKLANIRFGKLVNGEWDASGLIKKPDDFSRSGTFLTIKFLNDTQFVQISYGEPYAILYEINNPLPLKYFELGTSPFPAVSDYSRNAAIDSAPEAGILVTGQRDGNGINVYKYDKDKQTLKKIWVTH